MEMNSLNISELRKEFGDAMYLLDSVKFRNNFIELKDAFSGIYPHFNIAYSYKTNYIPKLCRVVNELGGYAEVVSEMELQLALKCGVNPDRIIWNGPVKSDEYIEEYALLGVTINADSLVDVERLANCSKKYPYKKISLGVRCNFDVGDGVVSRFGFDVEGEEFRNALALIGDSENIVLKSFQCHFAKRQIDFWPDRAKGMINLIEKVGIVPERIDLGGGLYGKMPDSLKSQFSVEIPTYVEYAHQTAKLIAEYFADKPYKPELIIEPGSALVGDCMKFVGTVKTIKDIRGKKIATILGSQKNISMSGVNPPIEIINFAQGCYYEDIDIAGYTCIEGDVIYRGYRGKLAVGDAVVISNCGSYSIVMKPPFILPNFPIVDISDGKTEIIKRKETFDDVFGSYIF